MMSLQLAEIQMRIDSEKLWDLDTTYAPLARFAQGGCHLDAPIECSVMHVMRDLILTVALPV